MIHTVALSQVAEQPWRNGGGTTRELLAWPDTLAWQLRISVARIDRDGPFSAFPGVKRWFAVLQGAGVLLQRPAGLQRMTTADAPLAFDGAEAPACTLIDGPTLDLNLMLRSDAGRGALTAASADAPCPASSRWRALYSHGAAVLSTGDTTLSMPAGTLAWSSDAPAGPWRVQASGEPLRAWWIHFEPHTT